MKVETAAERLFFTRRIVTNADPPNMGTGVIVIHKLGDRAEGPFLVSNRHVVRE